MLERDGDESGRRCAKETEKSEEITRSVFVNYNDNWQICNQRGQRDHGRRPELLLASERNASSAAVIRDLQMVCVYF
jgi:hypothetical protein